MKTFLLIAFVSSASYASDLCFGYVRNSPEWQTCKENATEDASRLNAINAQMQAVNAQDDARQTAFAQAEQEKLNGTIVIKNDIQLNQGDR